MLSLNENVFNGTHAKITGWFFIVAAISSIIGLKLYDPILNDDRFLVSANEHSCEIVLGAISELVLVVTAAGTGIMLFPLLCRYSERLALGYLTFRMLEVVLIIIGCLSILCALAISQQYVKEVINDKDHAQHMMQAFIGLHKWTFMLGPNFMLAINTYIYSFVFVRSDFLPTPMSKLGLVSSFLIMTAALLEMFGVIEQISIWGILLALPIAFYEMMLAIWLITSAENKLQSITTINHGRNAIN